MPDDDATLDFLRTSVAREAGLPESAARRLKGQTVGELRADAAVMRSEHGLPPLDDDKHDGRQRDESGRFAGTPAVGDMNTIIRAASGR